MVSRQKKSVLHLSWACMMYMVCGQSMIWYSVMLQMTQWTRFCLHYIQHLIHTDGFRSYNRLLKVLLISIGSQSFIEIWRLITLCFISNLEHFGLSLWILARHNLLLLPKKYTLSEEQKTFYHIHQRHTAPDLIDGTNKPSCSSDMFSFGRIFKSCVFFSYSYCPAS